MEVGIILMGAIALKLHMAKDIGNIIGCGLQDGGLRGCITGGLRGCITGGLFMLGAVSVFGQLETSYGFLDLPSSAHVMALGGLAPALIEPDYLLSDQNPALLGPEFGIGAGVSYMNYIGSGTIGAIRFGMPAGEYGAWSAGLRYFSYGEFAGFLPDGTSTGTFKPSDAVFEGSYAHILNDKWRGGVNYRAVYSTYEQYSAMAMGVDVGVNYYDEAGDVSFSAVLTNMGGQIKRLSERYNPLPFDLRLGYMQPLGMTAFRFSVSAHNLTRWHLPYYDHSSVSSEGTIEMKESFTDNLFRHLVFGLEYAPTERFYLAGGYDYKLRTDMSTATRNLLSGFSFGGGFRKSNFSCSVSYTSPHKAASMMMLNLGVSL